MKAVVTSDWHLDAHTMGVSRFPEIHRAILDMIATGVKEGAEYFFFLGDLCNIDNIEAYRHLQYVADTINDLETMGIKTAWMNGNHCASNGFTVFDPFVSAYSQNDNHRFFNKIGTLLTPSASFVFCPYPVSADTPFIRQTLSKELEATPPGKPVYVLSHMSVHGMPLGEESYEFQKGVNHLLPLDILDNYKHASRKEVAVIQGHYHKHQVFRAKGPVTVQVVGAPARFTYREADHSPNFLLLDF